MSETPDRAGVEDVLWRGLTAIGGVLSERSLADLAILIRVGEHLVAYETLVTQAYEFFVPINRALVDELGSLGLVLQADPKYGKWLAECVSDE